MADPIYLASDHRGYPLKQALCGRFPLYSSRCSGAG
jgi:hypothetical protein